MATKKTAPKNRKPVDAHKVRAFTVRMSAEQADIVERAAADRALDVASWIRMVAFEAAKVQTGVTPAAR